MSENESTHYGLSRLLRETFPKPSHNEITCLVGILHQFDILFLGETWKLPALEPEEAAKLVSRLYGSDEDRLLERFRDNWARLKNSSVTAAMVLALESHEFVDRIVPFDRGTVS
ncbi:MAG: hypothetical protein AAF802_29745 [Planctomycetota bacterium]